MIVYFEGLSCAGKTTLIEAFPEAGTRKICKPFSRQSQRRDLEFFLKADEYKCIMARNSTEPLVLVDRGYISTLVYFTVKHELSSDNQDKYMAYEWFIEKMGDGTLVRPDMYVFVDTPLQICKQRWQGTTRDTTDNVWVHAPERCLHWYRILFRSLEYRVPIHRIDGSLPIQETISILVTTFSRRGKR